MNEGSSWEDLVRKWEQFAPPSPDPVCPVTDPATGRRLIIITKLDFSAATPSARESQRWEGIAWRWSQFRRQPDARRHLDALERTLEKQADEYRRRFDEDGIVIDSEEAAEFIVSASVVYPPLALHGSVNGFKRLGRDQEDRDAFVLWCLRALLGCGLDVTSGEGDSLAGAMARALPISVRTIRRIWERARPDRRRRHRRCAGCGATIPSGSSARDRHGDYRCAECSCH